MKSPANRVKSPLNLADNPLQSAIHKISIASDIWYTDEQDENPQGYKKTFSADRHWKGQAPKRR